MKYTANQVSALRVVIEESYECCCMDWGDVCIIDPEQLCRCRNLYDLMEIIREEINAKTIK